MRQLAYVGEDGQIRVADLDATREIEITRAGPGQSEADHSSICNWPTWSPDGGWLAFFQYQLSGDEVQHSGVGLASADGSLASDVYALPAGAPIYMSWSPDGERLAVLVQESRELYLRVIGRRGGAAITVAEGTPLYFVWQPDSRGLVVHVGGGQGSGARIVWVRLEGGQATYATLNGQWAEFRAPCWSVRENAATFAAAQSEGSEILLQNGPDAPRRTLASTGQAPVFLWSPDGESLAFAARAPEYGGAYGPISVYRAATGAIDAVTDDPTNAFFWCPDSRHLLRAGGEVGGRMTNLILVDTVADERRPLGWVRPSRDLLLLFSHFDQYAQSAHLFSPGGDELVLAASIAQEQVNGSVPTVRQIIVRPLAGGGVQEVPARGRLAFWRPGR